MPDLDELHGFDPTLGAPLLPPSEIRRRGESFAGAAPD